MLLINQAKSSTIRDLIDNERKGWQSSKLKEKGHKSLSLLPKPGKYLWVGYERKEKDRQNIVGLLLASQLATSIIRKGKKGKYHTWEKQGTVADGGERRRWPSGGRNGGVEVEGLSSRHDDFFKL